MPECLRALVGPQNASILEIDLKSPGLRDVARALSPAVLRLGGSEAGQNVTYVGFPGLPTPCPTGHGTYFPNGTYYYCLTRSRWDEVLEFADATGLRLMLDLNLIGPAQSSSWEDGLAQIDALLAYTARSGHTPWAYELGNENQDEISPQTAAERVIQVHQCIVAHWPDANERPLLVGPSVHIYPDWIAEFLHALQDSNTTSPLDIFAYHMYSGYGKAPNIVSQVPSTAFLDDARGLVDTAAASVRFSGAGAMSTLPMLVSETAAAWSSGGPTGVCLSFASSFWYFDHLTHAAASAGGGHIAVARQTLVGGNYSLVDSNADFKANPDFFVALLWRQVVEGQASAPAETEALENAVRVFRATRSPVISSDTHRELRSFAACDPHGYLVVGIANLADQEAAVSLHLSSKADISEQPRDEWVLEPGEDNLLTRQVKLNGNPVSSTAGVIPPLPPRESDGPFVAPPKSISFLRHKSMAPKACAPHS